jgi:hypothetical protein
MNHNKSDAERETMENNLAEVMERQGITIRQLSDMTRDDDGGQVSTQTINNIRMCRECKVGTLERIAAALGLRLVVRFEGGPFEFAEKSD